MDQAEKDKQKKEQQGLTRDEDRLDREALEHAREAVPALNERVRLALMRGRVSGQTDDALTASLQKALEDAGLGGDEAQRASKEVIGEEGQKLNDDVARGVLEGRTTRSAVPEIHDAVSMLASVQSKVAGEDTGKQSVRLLEELVKKVSDQTKAIEENGRRPQRARLAP